MRGKIIKGIAGFYYVYAEDGIIYECKARGIFRNRKITPLVGDNVEISVTDINDNEGNIDDIMPRTNSLIRPAVANVDRALIFFARNDPKPDMGLIDRLLITMEKTDIYPIIVFNKSDLDHSPDYDLESEKEGFALAGYHVYEVCAVSGEGVDEILSELKGYTTAIAGPSGAGKSSFINRICPGSQMETGVISNKLGRGKHTTRHAEIQVIDRESFIVDTPGFTSYNIDMILPEELPFLYPEFSEYAGGCRFSGCSHTHEPDCAVISAVEAGKISNLRYERYKKFYQELKGIRRY
ncbi:MAG: ribosome small subunit-dependent GTPase A [Lachnospiraceae bacterium]|nr:ribosome small subunit-dependent GTPase A [Lachnospiraceae bacterium]